jgi:predicted RNA-binding Zn ribbon-like protein
LNAYEKNLAVLVEDFINTYDLYLAEPEHLREPADFEHFLQAHGIKPDEQITEESLGEMRQIRARLRDCWESQNAAEMLQKLNPLLGEINVKVQTEIIGATPALRFEIPPGASILQRLSFECARGIFTTVENYGIERLRSCAAEPCRDVFVDTSRNNTRRFCSERCANRYNIAAFRDRQKTPNEKS